MLQQEMRLAELLHETADAANEAPGADQAVAACLELVASNGLARGHAVRLDGNPVAASLWYTDDQAPTTTFAELSKRPDARLPRS